MTSRRRSCFFAILWCGLLVFSGHVIADEVDQIKALQNRIHKYRAAGQYSDAIPLAEELVRRSDKVFLDQPTLRAVALLDLANLYFDQGRYAEAETLYQRSLTMRETALGSDHLDVADSLNGLAAVYSSQGRFPEAERLFQRLIKLREKGMGSIHPSVARDLNNLATLYTQQGRYEEAEQLYQRSLTLLEKALGADHLDVATSLVSVAVLYNFQNRYAESEALLKRSLKLRETKLGQEHPSVASNLRILADVFASEGRYADAEPLYQRSLKLSEKALGPDHPDVADCLNSLAVLCSSQSRYAEAERLLRKSLSLREKILGPDHPDVADNFNNLAALYQAQERYAEAEQLYRQSLSLRQKTLRPDHPKVARSLSNLALVCALQKRLAEADPYFQQSLELLKNSMGPEHPDVGGVLYNLAEVHNVLGRNTIAESQVSQAIAIQDRAAVNPEERYKSYLLRSRIAWKFQEHAVALTFLRGAMDFAESQRVQAAGVERERATVFAGVQSAFEQMVTWQHQIGNDSDLVEVMTVIERCRARSLLDEMAMTGVNLDAGRPVAERDQLHRRELELKSRAAQLEKQWERAKTEVERERLLPELANAREAVYQQYRDQRASSPIYRKLLSASGTPISLKQLQQTLTRDKSLLLVYFLGEQAGYVVAIQSDQVRLTALTVSDETAKVLGCDVGPLTAKRMQAILMNEAKTGVMQKLADPATAKQAAPQLAALWPLLVPEVQRVRIQGGDVLQLMIVPDGPLSALPFEALTVNEGDSPTYLLDVAPPIQYAPSATVLFNLQQRATSKPDPMMKPVLAVGNAQYGPPQAASGDSLAMLTPRSRYVQRGGHLQPLPFSGTEVAWVADVFTKTGIGVGRLLQADATEANIRFNVPGRSIVHFACHGLADQEYGNFFGSLAVTPGPNAATNPADDGFLTLAEIYQLDLMNCQLAILSACDTNFGPHQRGEGTWALSRGFLVAGARRVVASNWLVDDEAAASLVSYFCGGLASDEKNGQTSDYASRLQSAKRWVRQQDKWSSPYFWAPFVLVGPH